MVPEKPKGDPTFPGFGYCQLCPDGTDCDARGIGLLDLPLSEGYWRSSQTSHNVVKCYAESACTSANVSSTDWMVGDQCGTGHFGPICNKCEKGYAMNVLGICDVCVTKVVLPTKTLITGVVFLSGVAFVAWFFWRKRR